MSNIKGLRVTARDKTAEIYIYGVIGDDFWGDGITAKGFADSLKGLGSVSRIDVHINSEGGDVFQGRTIYSLLKAHAAHVTVKVDGLAASAASLIAMSGDTIEMAEGSFLMIHEAWTVSRGRASDLRKTADLMDQVNETMVASYAARSGQKPDKIRKMMDEETWMDAAQAKSLGFADAISEPLKVAACVSDPNRFKNLPSVLRPKRAAALAVIEGMRKPASRR